jgi:hypothetical protein
MAAVQRVEFFGLGGTHTRAAYATTHSSALSILELDVALAAKHWSEQMLAMHFFRTIGPASRGALACGELLGLDGRGDHPTGGTLGLLIIRRLHSHSQINE